MHIRTLVQFVAARSAFVMFLALGSLLAASPVTAQREAGALDPPAADGPSEDLNTAPLVEGPEATSRSSIRLELLTSIDALEDELASADATLPSGLLGAGVVLTGLGAITPGVLLALDLSVANVDPVLWGGVGGASGLVLLGGLTLLTVGAVWLPSVNSNRARLLRRIDDRRRLFDAEAVRVGLGFGLASADMRVVF